MYASETKVPVERSKAEIERILARYGATHFAYTTMPEGAVVQFVKSGKRIRFLLPIPKEPTETGRGYLTELERWSKVRRSKWRALCLVIKAKLEAVEAGICTFEEEFLAHIVLSTGQTAGQFLIPKIEADYAGGKVAMLDWNGK